MDKLLGCIKSKTQWFAMALSIFGVIEANTGVFARIIGPDYFGWFVLAVGIIVAWLRWATSLPLDQK